MRASPQLVRLHTDISVEVCASFSPFQPPALLNRSFCRVTFRHPVLPRSTHASSVKGSTLS